MHLNNLSFRIPLLTSVLVLSAVTTTVTVAAISGHSVALDMEESKIIAVADRTYESLMELWSEIETDGTLKAESSLTREALQTLDAAFRSDPMAPQILKRAYIDNNPHEAGKKHLMDSGHSGVAAYDDAHARFHPEFRRFNERMGYYDVFLVNSRGDVVYSNFKETDFADNLLTGPLKTEGIGETFAAIMSTSQPFGSDMAAYSPSAGAAAAFWGAPVKDELGSIIGAFIIQIPTHKIEGILNAYVSEGGTSEAYLITKEDRYITQPRLAQDTAVLSEVSTNIRFGDASNEILSTRDRVGEEAIAIKKDVDFFGQDWALIFKVNTSEATTYVNRMFSFILAASAVVIVVSMVMAQLFARSLVKPIRALNEATSAMSSGRRDLVIPETQRADEIGSISKSLHRFQTSLKQGEAAQRDQADAQEEKLRHQERINAEIQKFREDRAALTIEIGSKLREISSFSRDLSDATKKVTNNITVIEQASGTTMETMNTVASAAEELSASVSEINQRTQTSRDRIQATENLVEKINSDIAHLEGYVNGISDIATLIQGIATKTSLLALNATIESARAGEAGKGFAVVASEVKDLSAQTATATHDIAKQIDQVREATNVSVESINSITENFGTLKSELMNIINAVDTQAQATAEIAKSASIANEQARTNRSSVVEVSAMVTQSDRGSEQVKKQTEELLALVSHLDERTEEFFREIR